MDVLGVLELTALPSIQADYWVPLVQETDALLVGGGDPLYLCYWMWQFGLADLLPELPRETVYVGVSGGSMVVTPISGEQYDGILANFDNIEDLLSSRLDPSGTVSE